MVELPYPGPPERQASLQHRLREAWKWVLTLGGAVGCSVLLLRPELRDTAAWLVCGGAAGIFPLDKIMDRFGVR